MISSEDVRHVTFDKAFQGYRREDVDAYLKEVAQTMDDLAAQNDDLQKKLVVLAQRIEQYRTMEDTLSTTMINAQRLGENVIREAKQKAAEIIRAANIKAEDREQRSRDDVELAKQEIVTLKSEADSFKRCRTTPRSPRKSLPTRPSLRRSRQQHRYSPLHRRLPCSRLLRRSLSTRSQSLSLLPSLPRCRSSPRPTMRSPPHSLRQSRSAPR